jgi:hypothetical protein
MFEKPFDNFVCEGETITCEVDGYAVTAKVVRDVDRDIDDDDCHNPDQSVTGCNAEQQARLLANRKAYNRDEWWYCGIVLSVSRNGIELSDHAASLWGIEANYPDPNPLEHGYQSDHTCNSYLRDVANELLPEALEVAKKRRAEMLETLAK